MSIQDLIDYWNTGATEDIETADILIEKRKLRHGLFFAHLAVEKSLKARVVETTNEHAPKIHNLGRLAELARLELTPEQRAKFLEFNEYCLVGRYPDSSFDKIDLEEAQREISWAREVIQWLNKK